jgi:hypothetical protein
MRPQSRVNRRQFLAGVAGVSAVSIASGAVVSPARAQQDYGYEPPAGYDIDDLVDVYNQNLDAAPRWLRNVVLTTDETIVVVFRSPEMNAEGGMDYYRLKTGANGRVGSVEPHGGPSEIGASKGGRIVVSVTEAALNSIILAGNPSEEGRRQYMARNIQLNSEGNFYRGFLFWLTGALRFFA